MLQSDNILAAIEEMRGVNKGRKNEIEESNDKGLCVDVQSNVTRENEILKFIFDLVTSRDKESFFYKICNLSDISEVTNVIKNLVDKISKKEPSVDLHASSANYEMMCRLHRDISKVKICKDSNVNRAISELTSWY